MSFMPQYSTNGVDFLPIGRSMLGGTFAGRFELVYPEPTTHTLAGSPAGAYGQPSIYLRAPLMGASGMLQWLTAVGGSALSASITVDTWNAYTGASVRVMGTLIRPRWDRTTILRWGDVVNYENVEIDIINCTLV